MSKCPHPFLSLSVPHCDGRTRFGARSGGSPFLFPVPGCGHKDFSAFSLLKTETRDGLSRWIRELDPQRSRRCHLLEALGCTFKRRIKRFPVSTSNAR